MKKDEQLLIWYQKSIELLYPLSTNIFIRLWTQIAFATVLISGIRKELKLSLAPSKEANLLHYLSDY
jgi:hypothetical protein